MNLPSRLAQFAVNSSAARHRAVSTLPQLAFPLRVMKANAFLKHAKKSKPGAENLMHDRDCKFTPSEFLLRRAGNNEQQRPVDVPHAVNWHKLKHGKKTASFSHTGSRFGRQSLAAVFCKGRVDLVRSGSIRFDHVIAAAA
jgi:hypothetical protein